VDVRETSGPIEAPKDELSPAPAVARADHHAILPANGLAPAALRDDISFFVGPNAAKFLRVYDAQERGYWPVLPCWPGFLVPLPWFLYRKMYLLSASSFIAVFTTGLHASPTARIAAGCVPSVLGIIGRWIYVSAARRKIAEIRDRLSDDGEARAVIGMAGGVSVAGAVLGSLIMMLGLLAIGGQAAHPSH
jgi:hypothetical protein